MTSNVIEIREQLESILKTSDLCCSKLLEVGFKSHDDNLKNLMTSIASEVRANFQKAISCSSSLFQSNVQNHIHTMELEKKMIETESKSCEEIKQLRNRVSDLLEIVQDQQVQNQKLTDGLNLKGIWSKLIDNENFDAQNFSTALTWISSLLLIKNNYSQDPIKKESNIISSSSLNSNNNNNSNYTLDLIQEVKKCNAIMNDQYDSVITENERLRALLSQKSGWLYQNAERIESQENELNSIHMKLADYESKNSELSKDLYHFKNLSVVLTEKLKNSDSSRQAYKDLSDRLQERIHIISPSSSNDFEMKVDVNDANNLELNKQKNTPIISPSNKKYANVKSRYLAVYKTPKQKYQDKSTPPLLVVSSCNSSSDKIKQSNNNNNNNNNNWIHSVVLKSNTNTNSNSNSNNNNTELKKELDQIKSVSPYLFQEVSSAMKIIENDFIKAGNSSYEQSPSSVFQLASPTRTQNKNHAAY